jgi:hypothetical protein
MRTLILGLILLVGVPLCGCGGEASTGEGKETTVLQPCPEPAESGSSSPSDSAEPLPTPPDCLRVRGGGAQPGAGSGAVGAGGPDGSITRSWSEEVIQNGVGTSSVVTQKYQAVVSVTLTKVDEGAYSISGTANVTSTYTSDWKSSQTSTLGPCNVHYTDNATAMGTVDVEGGLEAYDGFYQFYVNIPGVDGSNDTVRDDSGCNGPNNQETTPWAAAPITAGGSGDMTGPRDISGTSSEPRTGGEDSASWRFTLPE